MTEYVVVIRSWSYRTRYLSSKKYQERTGNKWSLFLDKARRFATEEAATEALKDIGTPYGIPAQKATVEKLTYLIAKEIRRE